MDKCNFKKRQLFANRIGNLAELMILRKPPFENLPLYTQIISYVYSKYLQYNDELPETLRENIISEEIEYAKHLIKMCFGVKEGPAFNKKFPNYAKTIEEFEKWIAKKEVHQTTNLDFDEPEPSIDFNIGQKFRMIIKEIKPEFIAVKKPLAPGVLTLSKGSAFNDDIQFLFDLGNGRDFFSSMLGFRDLDACLDVGNLFAREQSAFEFSSVEELKDEIYLSIKFVDEIIPEIQLIAKEIF